MSDAIKTLLIGEEIDESRQSFELLMKLYPSLRHELECDNNDELQS